jgi:tetratricopeptide (TPR) repeat protein
MDALDLEWLWGDGKFTAFVDGGIALSARAQALGNETQAAQIMSRVAAAARIAGKLELANHHLAVARKTAERLGLRALLRELRSNESACIWIAGDTSAALAISDEVMIEAAGDGDANRLVATSRRMAEMLESEGRYEEAVVAGAAALTESLHTGERWNRSEIHGHLAVNLLRVGRIDEAEANAAAAEAMVRGPEDIAGVSEAKWMRAHFLAFQGNHQEADATFRSAIASVERGEFVPLRASLRLDYAEFLLARGRASEAASVLAEVERLSPPPPWNYLATRRRALAAAVIGKASPTR